jgi:predicted nucleic-acid-binding Zn-ribbon protein
MKAAPCPNCGSDDLRAATADAGGGFGPDFLPGLSGMFSRSTFDVVVCCKCGLTRLFASFEALDKLLKSAIWHRA